MLMVSTRTCTQLDRSLHSFPLYFFFFESFKIICRAILLFFPFFSLLFFLILILFLSRSFSFSFAASITGVEGVGLQTEGVNFEAIWAMSSKLVQANQIKCNDIWRMLNTFGIESARASIVTEVQGKPLLLYSLSHSL